MSSTRRPSSPLRSAARVSKAGSRKKSVPAMWSASRAACPIGSVPCIRRWNTTWSRRPHREHNMSASIIRAAFAAATISIGQISASFPAVTADSPAANAAQAVAVIDLATAAGAARVTAEWRYHDIDIVPAQFPAAGTDQQPSGPPQSTFDYAPHAGSARFDDSGWVVIQPESLTQRRGHGRLSFNWYRPQFTVPAQIGGVDAVAASLYFSTRLDDYAEIWVDGELARPFGGSGATVIAGWNAVNR